MMALLLIRTLLITIIIVPWLSRATVTSLAVMLILICMFTGKEPGVTMMPMPLLLLSLPAAFVCFRVCVLLLLLALLATWLLPIVSVGLSILIRLM